METDSINPIRYRGYYFDDETGFYCINSRYYDPRTGRFINADTPDRLGATGELRGYNLYTYCGNNPVMYIDPTGRSIASVIVGTVIFLTPAIINLLVEGYHDYQNGILFDEGGERYHVALITGLISSTVSLLTGGLPFDAQLVINMASEGAIAAGEVIYYDRGITGDNLMNILSAFAQGAITAGIIFSISKFVPHLIAVNKTNHIIKNQNSPNIKINRRLAEAGYGQYKIGIHGFDGIVDAVKNNNKLLCDTVEWAANTVLELIVQWLF